MENNSSMTMKMIKFSLKNNNDNNNEKKNDLNVCFNKKRDEFKFFCKIC